MKKGYILDFTFVIGDKEIPAHRFLFSAFGVVPKTILENEQPLKIPINGINDKDFRTILEEIYTGKLTQLSRAKLPPELFRGDYDGKFFKKLYNNPSLSDCIVKVDGCTFHCHRAILTMLSPFFASAFSNNMKESINKEILLPDIDQEECAWILNISIASNPIYQKMIPKHKECLE